MNCRLLKYLDKIITGITCKLIHDLEASGFPLGGTLGDKAKLLAHFSLPLLFRYQDSEDLVCSFFKKTLYVYMNQNAQCAPERGRQGKFLSHLCPPDTVPVPEAVLGNSSSGVIPEIICAYQVYKDTFYFCFYTYGHITYSLLFTCLFLT